MSRSLSSIAAEIRKEVNTVAGSMIRLGVLLSEAKENCSDWGAWVEANLPFGVRQADRHIDKWKKQDLIAKNGLLGATYEKLKAVEESPPEDAPPVATNRHDVQTQPVEGVDDEEPETPREDAPEPPTDQQEADITEEDAEIPAWEQRAIDWDSLIRELVLPLKRVRSMVPTEHQLPTIENIVRSQLGTAIRNLDQAYSDGKCGLCEGDGCPDCHGHGFVLRMVATDSKRRRGGA